MKYPSPLYAHHAAGMFVSAVAFAYRRRRTTTYAAIRATRRSTAGRSPCFGKAAERTRRRGAMCVSATSSRCGGMGAYGCVDRPPASLLSMALRGHERGCANRSICILRLKGRIVCRCYVRKQRGERRGRIFSQAQAACNGLQPDHMWYAVHNCIGRMRTFEKRIQGRCTILEAVQRSPGRGHEGQLWSKQCNSELIPANPSNFVGLWFSEIKFDIVVNMLRAFQVPFLSKSDHSSSRIRKVPLPKQKKYGVAT
eukprot:363784-Chlamydomonas_euryale.AAC.10